MIQKIAVLFVVLYSVVESAPLAEQGCDINTFETNIFNNSLLLENHLACSSKGDKLKAHGFCQHLYKCPLDFSGEMRHCEAVCREDGTWDYRYPSCEDLVPLADYIQAQVMITTELEKLLQKNEQPKKYNRPADAIIHALDEEYVDPSGNVQTGKYKPDAKAPARVRRWVFVKPTPRKIIPKTTPETTTTTTTTTTAAKTKATKSKRITMSGLFNMIRPFCTPRLCHIVNGRGGCNKITDAAAPDYQLQYKVCSICVKIDACLTNVGGFGTRV